MGKTFKERLTDTIKSSMGLKFVIALSGWVLLLMLLGTVFIARMLTDYQYRAMENRGREIGTILAKSSVDRFIAGDLIGLNMLVEDVVKSREMISLVFLKVDGTPLTSAHASFNRENADVHSLMAAERTEDVLKLSSAIRRELSPVEVSVDVLLQGTRLGEIRLAFSRADVRANAVKVVLLLMGTALAIVLSISCIVYFMASRMIASPTSAAEAVASAIAAGDLTQKVQVSTIDEIGNLGRGLNRMAIGLKGMIGNIRGSSEQLVMVSGEVADVAVNVSAASRVQNEAVEEAASSVNEMHFSLKEIGGSMNDLSETAEQTSSAVIETAASIDEVARLMTDLSSSIEETSSAITQMSASISENAESVGVLSALAGETASTTTEISAAVREVESGAKQSVALAEAVTADAQDLGMRSIEKTIEGMRRIEEESKRTADVINRLGERAESIGGILTVIEDVTDETSLLALNAAILAAQAGEHGKGFAVVAAEIRELANRTASSTSEIGKLIVSVQDESREAVEVMRNGVQLAAEGSHLARETGDALRKILERADQSREMSRSISRAAAEQVTGIRQLGEAVDGINTMAHQIERATSEQKTGSEQIMRASERMREITHFVRSAAVEQVEASRNITKVMETMGSKVNMIKRASGEVRTGSDLIVKAIERIKVTARENAVVASNLNSAGEVLTVQTGALKKELGRFTM
jgi:methyl-accepting chemotaxis protein